MVTGQTPRLPRTSLAVILSVGIAGAGCARPPSPPSGPPSSPPAVAPFPSESASVLPEPASSLGQARPWTAVDVAIGQGRTRVEHVEGSEFGVLILGTENGRAAVWKSDDGDSWTRALLPGAFPEARPVAAAASAETAVVAARAEVGARGVTQIWGLKDGSWNPVSLAPEVFPRGSIVRALAPTASGFVAVGAVFPGDPETLERAEPAVWTSPDGWSWDRRAVEIGQHQGGWLLSVVPGPAGMIAGGEVLRGGSIDATILASGDGGLWTEVEAPGLSGVADERVLSVASTKRDWLATGRISPPECRRSGCITQSTRLWSSTDLNEWDVVDLRGDVPAVFASDEGSFFGVAPTEGGILVSSSPDGRVWTPLTEPLSTHDGVVLGGWARFNQDFLVAGYSVNTEPRTIMAWVARTGTADPQNP